MAQNMSGGHMVHVWYLSDRCLMGVDRCLVGHLTGIWQSSDNFLTGSTIQIATVWRKRWSTWNCAPWCIITKVVHNAAYGAQMPLFSYEMVHKCPPDRQNVMHKSPPRVPSGQLDSLTFLRHFPWLSLTLGHKNPSEGKKNFVPTNIEFYTNMSRNVWQNLVHLSQFKIPWLSTKKIEIPWLCRRKYFPWLSLIAPDAGNPATVRLAQVGSKIRIKVHFGERG